MNNKITIEYKLNGNEQATILNFLYGNITSREAGKIIGVSHQTIINLTTNLIRSWIKQGKLELDLDKVFPGGPNVPQKQTNEKI